MVRSTGLGPALVFNYVLLLTNLWMRNLLPGGLCKINQLCAIAFKIMNNWPCNWKCVPLPEHMCYCLQLMNHWPCKWTCVPPPAHKPHLNRFCLEISFLRACAKSIKYVCYCFQTYEQLALQLEMCGTTCPQAPSEQVLPRNLLPGGLCQVNPLCGIAYKLLKQLILQLDMCGTTCPQAPSEQVLPRNLLPGGLVQNQSSMCAIAYKLMNHWPCNWTCVALLAHKPHPNRFCPEISFLGACAKLSMCYCLQTYEQLTLRKRLEARVVELGLVPRLVKRISNPSAEGLLSPEEVGLIQSDLAEFLQSKGCRCTKTVEPHQPFLLDCWDAVARLCQDQDLNLPSQLKAGVPTGVVEPMHTRVQEDTGQGTWSSLEECATTCPQAPSEQVLPRNLLPGGLCKINQLCAIAYHLMKQLTMHGHVCHYLPTNPVWTGFAQKSPSWGLVKINQVCVLLLTNLWTTDPAIGHVCHYLPTNPVWTGFA